MAGEAALLIERALLAAGVMLLMVGAVAAWTSGNGVKRLGGLVVTSLGAVLALAALRVPGGVLASAIAAGFAQLALGVALLVRLQEAYGAVEMPEIDAVDAQSESTERTP